MSSNDWDRAYLADRAASGANWFYWLAALSLGNSIWAFFNAGVSFWFGPGVTLFADLVGEQGGPGWKLAGLGFGIFFAAALALIGVFARRKEAVFLAGILLYLLDTALVLLVQAWIHLAVHAYVLFRLVQGWLALRNLKALGPADSPEVPALPPAVTADRAGR